MTKNDDIIKLIEASGMLQQTQLIVNMQLEAIKIEDPEVHDSWKHVYEDVSDAHHGTDP